MEAGSGSKRLCVLGGAGIKALHINSNTKDEKKAKSEKGMKRWKMTCGPLIT